jgi:hypothetical protein
MRKLNTTFLQCPHGIINCRMLRITHAERGSEIDGRIKLKSTKSKASERQSP